MRERDIEDYLVQRVKAMGGIAYKFTSPSRRGVPDRVVLLPEVPAQFVELKVAGQKPTAAQLREHARMRATGSTSPVWVIDSLGAVEKFLEAVS